ncbi:MAG TPA: hypothetical protein V6C97_08380 [Oculatellaceae cyanobacterium]
MESSIKNYAQDLCDGVSKFAHAAAYEAIERPILGAYQLASKTSESVLGEHLPKLEITKPDSSGWSTAGSFVGSVVKYAALSKLVHNAINPSETRAADQLLGMSVRDASLESTIVGGADGFLTLVDDSENYWREKGIHVVESAGSFGVMGGTAAAIGKSKFMNAERGSLSRAIATNGLAGIAGGTTQSILDTSLHHRSLDLRETAMTATSYGLFGAAFGGASHIISARPIESTSAENNSSTTRTTLAERTQLALQKVQTHATRIGQYIDDSIAQVNPFLLDSGLQPAYATSTVGGFRPGARAFRPATTGFTPNITPEARPIIMESRMVKPVQEPFQGGVRQLDVPGRAPSDMPPAEAVQPVVRARKAEAPRAVSSDATANEGTETTKPSKKAYDIKSVLAKSDRGLQISDAVETLMEEHPGFFKGLKAEWPNASGSGRDSIMVKLADGRYKNALLRFTTIFGEQQDTLSPSRWDPEWGTRPYDAPILSRIISADQGVDTVYAYVQEYGDGAINANASHFDVNEDASFARDANDPSFEQLTRELEERGEEWVDPGSRQLVWSNKKNRLVLVDYPAIMRSNEVPPEWRDANSGKVTDRANTIARVSYQDHNYDNEDSPGDEEPTEHSHQVLDFSQEERRYRFLNQPNKTPLIPIQKEIAQQLLDGDSDRDIATVVDWMFKDTLKTLNMTAKDAIKSTREALKKEKLM